MSHHTVRLPACLPTREPGLPSGQSGEDRHRDLSVLRVQLGFLLPPSLPSPGNIQVPSAGLAADSSPRHPSLTRVLRQCHA